MKTFLNLSAIGLFVLFSTGCSSFKSSPNDEAVTVSKVIAAVVPPSLAFQAKADTEHILSSLDKSQNLDFGVVLDNEKQVFATYFKPDAASQKEAVIAKISQLLSERNHQTFVKDHGMTLAITPVDTDGSIVGYVVVGRSAS